MIADALPRTMAYWAPELLRGERHGEEADVWALGVALYQIVTGEQPFDVADEANFREEVQAGVQEAAVAAMDTRLRAVLRNCLVPDRQTRWKASFVLAFVQEHFARVIQATWKAFVQRRRFRNIQTGLIKIQSLARGYVAKKSYGFRKAMRTDLATVKIQAAFRGFLERQKYQRFQKNVQKAQAYVLQRQQRRAYLKLKQDALRLQAYIKRYIAMSWYQKVKDQKQNLGQALQQINETIGKYNQEASRFKNEFTKDGVAELPRGLDHMTDFEGMQRKALDREKPGQPTAGPGLLEINEDYARLKRENELLKEQLDGRNRAADGQRNRFGAGRPQRPSEAALIDERLSGVMNDSKLREELGPKYDELGGMVDRLKADMKRLADMAKKAKPLPLRMQHVYQYSKWDAIHEPYNVVENVLKDDEKVYKALQPVFDFTVNAGNLCYISSIVLAPGDCGPQKLEVYLSSSGDHWSLVKTFTASKEAIQNLEMPGENLAKHVRIRCVNNIRGGNLVSVRFIQVRGLPQEMLPARSEEA